MYFSRSLFRAPQVKFAPKFTKILFWEAEVICGKFGARFKRRRNKTGNDGGRTKDDDDDDDAESDARWAEWLRNRSIEYWVTCSSIRSFPHIAHYCACAPCCAHSFARLSISLFARTTHSFACSALLDFLACSSTPELMGMRVSCQWNERVDFIQFQPIVRRRWWRRRRRERWRRRRRRLQRRKPASQHLQVANWEIHFGRK